MSLTSRVCLAVGIDSVGHVEYYKRVFERKGIRMPWNTRTMLSSMKRKRDYDQVYQAEPKRKRKRSELKFARMKEGLKKQMADKAVGRLYDTGHNMALQEEGTAVGTGPKPTKYCIFCGIAGHKTTRSKSCEFFGWAKPTVEAEMVRRNVEKATRGAVGVSTTKLSSEVQSEGTCYFFGSQYDSLPQHTILPVLIKRALLYLRRGI
jgi:hypothetical protein